jgi:hypothetical protein
VFDRFLRSIGAGESYSEQRRRHAQRNGSPKINRHDRPLMEINELFDVE